MKKSGFTLVEMLVVLGILGVLVAVILGVSSDGLESARAAKCLSNMKMLAQGWKACEDDPAMQCLPFAGSFVTRSAGSIGGGVQVGWIGCKGTETFVSCYVSDEETREECITNGQLYEHVNNNRDVFVCPSHKLISKSHPPAWSYVMNEMFGWYEEGQPVSPGSVESKKIKVFKIPDIAKRNYKSVFNKNRQSEPPRDRVLLFAEIPFVKPGNDGSMELPFNEGAGTECDCTLQFKDKNEYIGFNHKSSGNWVAHVAFCDGHVEKLLWHKNMSRSDAELLTKMLCTGAEVSYNGTQYEDLYE